MLAFDTQAIAQFELEQHVERQADAIASEYPQAPSPYEVRRASTLFGENVQVWDGDVCIGTCGNLLDGGNWVNSKTVEYHGTFETQEDAIAFLIAQWERSLARMAA